MADITVKIDIESIVKVECLCVSCKNHLQIITRCNLKHIRLSGKGECMNKEVYDGGKQSNRQ